MGAVGVATLYQLGYLVWFHRMKPMVLFSVLDPMWFLPPLAALLVFEGLVAFGRAHGPDQAPGVYLRRLASWMLVAALLQFPLRTLGPYTDRVALEVITVGGIVAVRELNYGHARWIAPSAVALFVAWLPFASIAAELDGGAYFGNALVAAALVLHARYGFIEARRAPADPARSVAVVTLPHYRWVILLAATCQLATIVWTARDAGPMVLVYVVVLGAVVMATTYAVLAWVSHSVFGPRSDLGPGGARRRALGWLLVGCGVASAARVALVDSRVLTVGTIAQAAAVVAVFAVRELRNPPAAWIVPTVLALVAAGVAALGSVELVDPGIGIACAGLMVALVIHAIGEVRERGKADPHGPR